MATTTNKFQVEIELNDDFNYSPAAVGRALQGALSTLPDEPMDYVFDSYHQGAGAEQHTERLVLLDAVATEPTGPREIGVAYLTMVGA